VVKLPYSVDAVARRQDALMRDAFLQGLAGEKFTEDLLSYVSSYLCQKISARGVDEIFYSVFLTPLRNTVLDADHWRLTLRRLVATVLTSTKECPALPLPRWTILQQDEWTPVFVKSISQADDHVWRFQLRSLGGTTAESEWSDSVSEKSARRIVYFSGFNPRSDVSRFYHVFQLVQLRLVLLLAAGSTPSNVRVVDCGRLPSFETYNRRINKLRHHETRTCPFAKLNPCFSCPIGQDRCRLAVIPFTKEEEWLPISEKQKQERL
jgi:hypothetical protein